MQISPLNQTNNAKVRNNLICHNFEHYFYNLLPFRLATAVLLILQPCADLINILITMNKVNLDRNGCCIVIFSVGTGATVPIPLESTPLQILIIIFKQVGQRAPRALFHSCGTSTWVKDSNTSGSQTVKRPSLPN